MACIEDGDGLGLGLSQDGAYVAGRHPIIKQPSVSPISSHDSNAPFSHHRSPSWVRSQQSFEYALPSPVPEQPLSPRQRASNAQFAAEASRSYSDLNVGQASVESNYIDQLESYESGISPKVRNHSNTSFTSTLSQIKRVSQRVRKDSFKKTHGYRTDSVATEMTMYRNGSLATEMSMSNDDPLQNNLDSTTFSNTPIRNRAAMDCMFSEGISPRTRISQSSTISTRSSSKSVDEIAKRRSDLAGIQQTDFGTLDSFNGLPYARDTSTDLYSSTDMNSTTIPESQQSTPTERVSFNPSLALLMAEEGRDVRVEANGRPLSEIEPLITSRTTHLILSNCHDASILEYLERVLPIVSHSLVVLDVSYCQLNELPQGLSQCTRLEELNLSGNHFLHSWHTDADALVRFYSTLQVLLIDHCALTILPGVLMHFRQLRSLSARGNHLTHLPAWLHHLRRLERISIGENPFIGPWIDICLPFTTAVVYTSTASDLEHSVRLAADASANQDTIGRSRSQSFSPGSLSQFNLSKNNPMTRNEDVLEELEDEDQSTEDPPFGRTLSSQYGNQISKAKVRPTVSTSDLKSLSDLEVSSAVSTPSTDACPATPSSIASSTSSPRKSSAGEADIGRWLTFRRKKVSRKASTTVLVVPTEPLPVSPAQSTISLATQEKKKISKDKLRPNTAGANTPPERTSSLSTRSSTATLSLVKGVDDDSSSLGSKSDRSTPRTQKQLHRTSFLPFALPIDPDARTAIDADIHQRHNVRILLEYLEDLSLLNPDQRRLNDWLDRPRSESISSQGSSSYMPALSRSGSESASSISNSTRPSSDDESQAKITSCTSLSSIREKQDSGSVNQPEPVLAPVAVKDDAIRRANIIGEIIATEQTYVKTLGELIDIYIIPSTKVDAHNQPQIPISERRIVFGNVEAIQHFHSQALLPSLCSAAQELLDKQGERPDANDAKAVEAFNALTAQVAESIAQTFERHVAFFRMYTAYVNNVESGQARVASWLSTTTPSAPYLRAGYSMSNLRREAAPMSKSFDTFQHNALGAGKLESESLALQSKDRKRIKLFLQRARLDKNHSQISLEAYLHLPVQRVPRYRLLFEDLVKCCPSERLKDGRSIINALGSINSIATMMNESKRQCEMNRRLLRWQERIRGTFPSPLVQPHRRLLHDGSLVLTRIVTRIPSFTARRVTIVGDTTTYELMEDPTLLQIADAEQLSSQTKAEDDQSRGHKQQQGSTGSSQNFPPPPLPPKDHKDALLQVHHLEQRFVSTAVEVILCNDILVILEASHPIGFSSSMSSATAANLTLFTVMRMEGEAKVVDERTLRIGDAEKIYYLTAKNRKEAEEWQRSFAIATRRPSM
ncbi:uncharacterized protein FA14DRAFT_10116 [Meira miltonrushii]|uniref:DH domain-containing protein n=1 Tax=Meira miltonrushii TaxID=1280837 RepID=A0A316VNI3_9BASI|nr:uncharacterized protein FA14DRAFT_10116 [Meira miltonrushii]PWN37115.1 hypothetical protein FA14DRAFT_10116 [Meira miltonrushii]